MPALGVTPSVLLFQPQNLLLTGPFPNCDVKLCDFGISRQVNGGGELREIMGTADYMGKSTSSTMGVLFIGVDISDILGVFVRVRGDSR